jgi:glucose-1-phosphate thymidylyltransferase
MWGIIPAAGAGTRIQPLAFSKELLPVGSMLGPDGVERPRAVTEYLVERMLAAGATRICFVISPGKADILSYFGAEIGPATAVYVVQQRPAGLCDAIFRALPLIGRDEDVLIGLPDTIWLPQDGFRLLPPQQLSLLLFPVDHPEFFDAVITDDSGRVREVQVKKPNAGSMWIWGAIRCRGAHLHDLHQLWLTRRPRDLYIGELLNAYLAAGYPIFGRRAGRHYVDIGTLHGYREAIVLLDSRRARLGSAVAETQTAARFETLQHRGAAP